MGAEAIHETPPDPEAAERPSSEAALRALGTPALLDQVVDAGYVGATWIELQRRLIEHALDDLTRSLGEGSIVRRCAAAGYGLRRVRELQSHPFPEEIAAEATEACLHRFRDNILVPGVWDPGQGTRLEVFFVACCLPDVANAYRRYSRWIARGDLSLDVLLDDGNPRLQIVAADPRAAPAEVVMARDLILRTIAPWPIDDQTAVILEAAGWSRAEIADFLEISRGALDTRLSRARKRVQDNRRSPQ